MTSIRHMFSKMSVEKGLKLIVSKTVSSEPIVIIAGC
jgi:hypothetical protein